MQSNSKAINMEPEEEVLQNKLEGWLTEKATLKSKRHWCTLSGNWLMFWKDPKQATSEQANASPKAFDMSIAHQVIRSRNPKEPFGLEIVTSKKKIALVAASRTDCDEWLKHLQLGMQHRRKSETLRASRLSSFQSSQLSFSDSRENLNDLPIEDDVFNRKSNGNRSLTSVDKDYKSSASPSHCDPVPPVNSNQLHAARHDSHHEQDSAEKEPTGSQVEQVHIKDAVCEINVNDEGLAEVTYDLPPVDDIYEMISNRMQHETSFSISLPLLLEDDVGEVALPADLPEFFPEQPSEAVELLRALINSLHLVDSDDDDTQRPPGYYMSALRQSLAAL